MYEDGTLPPLRKLLRSYKYKYNLCAHVVNHGVAGRQATASVSYAMNICVLLYFRAAQIGYYNLLLLVDLKSEDS